MCLFKKRKIRDYLSSLGENKSTFDMLLEDYLSGELKMDFQKMGLTRIELGVDLFHTIWMQAKYGNYFVDIHIYTDEISIALDLDEADDGIDYPLTDKKEMMELIKYEIKKQTKEN